MGRHVEVAGPGDSSARQPTATTVRRYTAKITAAAVPIGLVAFADERPVGWTRVYRAAKLPGVLSNRALKRILPDDKDAWWGTASRSTPSTAGTVSALLC